MAWWVAAAAVVGAVAKNDADQKASRAARKAGDRAMQDKLKAADSLLYASVINRSLDEASGRETQSAQIAAFASSGVDITSGSVVSTLAASESQMLRNDFLSKHKAEAQADLIRAGAAQIGEQQKLAEKNLQARQTQNIIGAGMTAAKEI